MSYQLADEAENAVQQQTDSCDDLEQRFGEETPKWVELLLGMWHALNLAFGVVNGLANIAGELFFCPVSIPTSLFILLQKWRN